MTTRGSPILKTFVGTLFMTLAGCSSAPQVQVWTPALQQAEPYRAPFVSCFDRSTVSRLCFVASSHDGSPSSINVRTIKSAFERLSPEIVIVEGIPARLSPAFRSAFNSHVQYCADHPTFEKCTEVLRVSVLAQQAGIPVQGGEPTDQQEFQTIRTRSHGAYGPRDYLYLELSRAVIQAKRQLVFTQVLYKLPTCSTNPNDILRQQQLRGARSPLTPS